MRITIITATFNNEKTIEQTLESVKNQTYSDIEHIIIDGNSSDKTIEVIKKFEHINKIVSEPDNGIYYALNKGLQIATGDVVGFLHADDFYANNDCLSKIAKAFTGNDVDAVYGNLQYVAFENTDKIIRNWISNDFNPKALKKGWMPPHPTFYAKKELYNQFGDFNTKYKISADYDLMLRFLTKNISVKFIPETIIKMRVGGISNKNIKSILNKSKEDLSAMRNNKVGGFLTLVRKNTSKISQFFIKKEAAN